MHIGQPNLRPKRKALSGLEGLLVILGLEVMAESVSAGTRRESWRREWQIVGVVTLKLWVPNEVQTNEIESMLVSGDLREQVE